VIDICLNGNVKSKKLLEFVSLEPSETEPHIDAIFNFFADYFLDRVVTAHKKSTMTFFNYLPNVVIGDQEGSTIVL
jgi:hypothetical protein